MHETCVVMLGCAACHVEQKQSGAPRRPSLIVCPPTLVGHWPHEITKFVGSDVLSVCQVSWCSLHTPCHLGFNMWAPFNW